VFILQCAALIKIRGLLFYSHKLQSEKSVELWQMSQTNYSCNLQSSQDKQKGLMHFFSNVLL
jgi:hypothetical protein